MATVLLKRVRIAFPALFEAKSINDGDPRFGANFIIEPNSANAKAITAAMKDVADVKWAKKADSVLEELKKKGKVCYVEDEKKSSSGDVYAGFEDMYHISANNASRPSACASGDLSRSMIVGREALDALTEVALSTQPWTYGHRITSLVSVSTPR